MSKVDRWEKAAERIAYYSYVRPEKKTSRDILRLINKALKTDPVCKTCGHPMTEHTKSGFCERTVHYEVCGCMKFILDRKRS